jgi:hypothetical protein
LETAKAFGAPLLANCNSNDTVEGLVHNVEDQIVKYGATKGDDWRIVGVDFDLKNMEKCILLGLRRDLNNDKISIGDERKRAGT